MREDKKPKVIVSCLGKFHAFALCEQLERLDALDCFFTSYSSIKNPIAKYFVARKDKEKISKNLIRTNLLIAAGVKLYKNAFFWNEFYDRWVARKIRSSSANIFIGWSGMSKHSILAAKKKGMVTILHRGSSHIVYQNEILNQEYKKFGQYFEISKDKIQKEIEEYHLCDYISVPSSFAYHSFINKGIAKNKMITLNYGVGSSFQLGEMNHVDKQNDEFTILYMGKVSLQKGVTYLIDAIIQMRDKGYKINGLFIGGIDPFMEHELSKRNTTGIKFLGHINHYSLPKYIVKANVAVIPSLQDGFAKVVPQIMACGLPVIVSQNTGAFDLIKEGENGYIVPIRDTQAIIDKLKILYDNPEKLDSMQAYLKNNQFDMSWDSYGLKYHEILKSLL